MNNVKTFAGMLSEQMRAYEALKHSKTGVVVRATIQWRDFNGLGHIVTAGYFDTDREARKRVLRMAVRDGYTYPKWWQWWRWSETRPSLDFTRFT